MKTIQLGFSRRYNAGMCELLNGEEIAFRFKFETVDVEAYIGPRHRHIVMSMTVGPNEPRDEQKPRKPTRAQAYQVPGPELHPADLYVELIASQNIAVDDELAEAFLSKKGTASSAILRLARDEKALYESALDYAAGMLGLRLNEQFINKPIDSQCFAYRRKGEPYCVAVDFHITTVAACKLDLSQSSKSELRRRFPRPKKEWRYAADVLAWLLRAWSAKDPVEKFVSLFIPLECVIPALSKVELRQSDWGIGRAALLALVNECAAGSERSALLQMINGTMVSPPLVERFINWATKAALPGWESDIAAFRRFYKMRNHLVHRGKSNVELRVELKPKDVRSLQDITERYVSLALFGDAEVYSSVVRPS